MMSVGKLGRILGLSLLAVGVLVGCHEPNQPAPASEQEPVKQKAAAATAAKGGDGSQSLVVYHPESNATELKTCNLESVDRVSFHGQKVPVSGAKAAHFTGWIVATGIASPRYTFRFENKVASHYFQVMFTPTAARPDVAASLGEKAAHAGFALDLNLKALPAADYHIYLAALDGVALHACDNGRIVTVGP